MFSRAHLVRRVVERRHVDEGVRRGVTFKFPLWRGIALRAFVELQACDSSVQRRGRVRGKDGNAVMDVKGVNRRSDLPNSRRSSIRSVVEEIIRAGGGGFAFVPRALVILQSGLVLGGEV